MTHPTATTTYLEDLRDALAGRRLPDDDVESVLADVAAHCSASGQDPLEAFGPPGVYAAQYGAAPTSAPAPAAPTTPWWARALLVAIGALVVVPGAVVLFAFVLAAPTTGSAATVTGLLVAVALLVGLPMAVHRAYRPDTTWWTTAAVGLVVAGVAGFLLGVLATVAIASFGGAADVETLCTDGVCTTVDHRPHVLGLAVQDLGTALLALAYVLVCSALVVRGRRRSRR